tara:strand:- start:2340 stop:2537 length:198 start_codon:yes stop_codon:yes gene_type:complete
LQRKAELSWPYNRWLQGTWISKEKRKERHRPDLNQDILAESGFQGHRNTGLCDSGNTHSGKRRVI